MELTPRKIVFFSLIGIICIGIGIALSGISNNNPNNTSKGPSSLSIWVVGEDSTGYKSLEEGFKKLPGYAGTSLQVTKFAQFKDYERALLTAFLAGKGPDIFMIPDSGAANLEDNIEGISADSFPGDTFQTTFLPWFDSLIVEEAGSDGKPKLAGFKGVPLGYETPVVYYNAELTGKYPSTWSQISARAGETSQSDTSFLGIGLGSPYVLDAPEIVSALLLQDGISSLEDMKLKSPQAPFILYQSFLGKISSPQEPIDSEPVFEDVSNQGSDVPTPVKNNSDAGNNLANLVSLMDTEKLTVADLFIRGKIASVIGFPSYLTELEDAVKRAGNNKGISERQILTAPFPQKEELPRSLSIARYYYFALSKYGNNKKAANDLLLYFSTPEAGKAYLKSFPFRLPAQRALVADRINESPSPVFPRISYEHFLDSKLSLQIFSSFSRVDFLEQLDELLAAGSTPGNLIQSLLTTQYCFYEQISGTRTRGESCR